MWTSVSQRLVSGISSPHKYIQLFPLLPTTRIFNRFSKCLYDCNPRTKPKKYYYPTAFTQKNLHSSETPGIIKRCFSNS